MISGLGNRPTEVDLTGATFSFTAIDGNDNIIGSAEYSLAAGQVYQAWLTITSSIAFRRLEVRELAAATLVDQYFSNIITSEQAVQTVPEPSSAAIFFGATALAGFVRRRRKASV